MGVARTGVGPAPTATRFVTVGAGQDTSAIDFQLRNHAVLTGKVLDENKDPLPDITVMLVAREYSLGSLRNVYASVATTDDRGEFALNRVEPGRAFLLTAQKRKDAISEYPLDPKARKQFFQLPSTRSAHLSREPKHWY